MNIHSCNFFPLNLNRPHLLCLVHGIDRVPMLLDDLAA